MMYVLVLIMSGLSGNSGGVAVTTAEFGSMEACQAAAAKYEAVTKNLPQSTVSFCTRKT